MTNIKKVGLACPDIRRHESAECGFRLFSRSPESILQTSGYVPLVICTVLGKDQSFKLGLCNYIVGLDPHHHAHQNCLGAALSFVEIVAMGYSKHSVTACKIALFDAPPGRLASLE